MHPLRIKRSYMWWLTVMLICFYSNSFCQDPVLLRVVKAEQHDTLGCNIVEDLTRLAYKHIQEGKKFWDSPQKEIQITGHTLKEIERTSETSFLTQPVIYIYEYWSGTGKNLKTVTSGFGFFNRTKTGEEVSYGYLDFSDIKDIVLNSPVNSNANGNINSTLAYYLSGKRYHYHIIQYGSKRIDNITESERIKHEITGGTGIFPSEDSPLNEIERKLVTYNIDDAVHADSLKHRNAVSLLNAIETYLKTNREVFFNLGGDRLVTHVGKKAVIDVSRLEVNEVWKKIEGVISYDLVSVTIFVNDSALNTVLYRDMIKMEITIGLKSWIDFIREKEFPVIIQRINDQVIKKTEAYQYFKALQTSDWSSLTEVVKSF